MRQLKTIFCFELRGYLQSKAYVMSTLILSGLLLIILMLPSLLPGSILDNFTQHSKSCYGVVDTKGYLGDLSVFEKKVPFSKIVLLNSRSELEAGIQQGIYESGIEVNSLTDINYIVKNTRVGNADEKGFKEAVADVYRKQQIEMAHIDYETVQAIYDKEVTSHRIILGKDAARNYAYTYILSIIIYAVVIIYGHMIATAITTEKSNRAMEILITTTNPRALIIGKVFAGACASFAQIIIILGIGILTYFLHVEAWGHCLDFIFGIPWNVLITFFLFGILGFIFYAFIFASLGALVSRVEEVSKSISVITFIFIIVFIIGQYGMINSESMLIRVASFIPISSCMAMFIRVAMGNVTLLELCISMLVLVLSTIVSGVVGAKLYRLGTMYYQQKISVRRIISALKLKKL